MFKRLTSIIVLLASFENMNAQVAFSSLEDVWKYADAHNITIRTATYELDKVQYAKKQSYLAFLPQVSLSGSFTNNTSLQTTLIPAAIFGGAEGVYTPVQFGQKYIYAAGGTAQLDILNLQTWFNVRMANETEDLNRASLANAKKTTYQQIATQYYSFLLSKEAARLASASAAIADSVYQSVNNKFQAGTANQANVDIAKLNSERAQQTNITAQYQMQTSKNSLKGLLDLSVTDSLTIESSLQAATTTASENIFADDPAIRVAGYQSKLSLSQYKVANANFLPTLSVAYSNTTQQNDNKFEPFQGGPQWYPARYWSIRASWNIFTGGSRWLQSQKNKINYRESQLQLENTQKQSGINDENLRLSYLKAQAILTKTESVMHLSFDNYTHISNRYETGLASIEERLNAFKDYIDYQNQYLNSLSEMLVQLYQIKIRQQSL